jgi:hypothetical protein
VAARLPLPRHGAALATAFIYFAAIFTLAFVLGVARTLVVAPRLGATAGVLLEIPVLWIASWLLARRLVWKRSFAFFDLAAIGAVAFALTMATEAALSELIRGQALSEWASDLATPLGLVGLGGQLGFAILPLLARGRKQISKLEQVTFRHRR